MIQTNQVIFPGNRAELSPRSFTHVFKKIKTTIGLNCMSKALRFLQKRYECTAPVHPSPDTQHFLFSAWQWSRKTRIITLYQLNDSYLFISYRTTVLKHFALILAAAWEPVLHTVSPPRGPPYRGKCPKPLGLAICAAWPTDSCHSDRDCGGELQKCCQGDCSKYCLAGKRGI